VTGSGEHGLDDVPVEPPGAHLVSKLSRRVIRRPRWTVRPGLPHRLIRVGGTDDARGARDRAARQTTRIAGAVEPFTVLHRDARDGRERL
jgi:hypothetical protein